MITLTKCEQVGHNSEGQLVFAVSGASGEVYEFAITSECFMQLFALGWQEGRSLGEPDRHGRALSLETDAAAAEVDMRPGIVLMSGPLSLAVPVPDDVLAALLAEAVRLRRAQGRPH